MIREWINSLLGRKKEIESTPFVPEFRVVRLYGKFYIEMKNLHNEWMYMGFTDGGELTVTSSYELISFETAEEACEVLAKVKNFQRYFPEYDKVGFAVIDCPCQENSDV